MISIDSIADWIEQQKIKILTGFIVCLIFAVNIVFIDNAFAQTLVARSSNIELSNQDAEATNAINERPEQSLTRADGQYNRVAQDVEAAFQKLVTQTQLSFEKALQDANNVISDLAQQLERVTTEKQVAVRKQIKQDLENRQDLLENIADSVDDLAEKVKKFNKKLQNSIQQSQVAIDNEFQKNARNIQQSLENVARNINRLADDTERAKENTAAAFRNRIGQQLGAVRQALEQAELTIKAINQNPA